MNGLRRCGVHTHTYTVEYYSTIKWKEIMPFATTLMDLEIIILSEANQRHISYDITYMWNLKYKYIYIYIYMQITFFPKQQETHRNRKPSYGYQRANEGVGRDK